MLKITRQILISAPKESVSRYLQDLTNMTEYATKVDKVELPSEQPSDGLVEVQGRFMGLPWRGAFKMELTRDGGFRGEMIRGPLRKMVGGYHLRTVTGGTVVTHDEQYAFSLPLRPLTFLAKRWIERSVEVELGAVKEGAERLHRQLQLEQIEKAG